MQINPKTGRNRAVYIVKLAMMCGVLSAYAPVQQLGPQKYLLCGAGNRGPVGSPVDEGRRPCASPSARQYQPKYRGLGYDVLKMESEACFVPDSSYKLLDDVVEESIQRSKAAFASGNLTAAQKATAVSTIVGEVLESRGFVLWIPTESLGDALWKRGQPGEADRYIFDCDTGSMVLLTVAENLSMKAALVDITLTSGNGHNYVRWQLPGGQSLDWDMNLRSPCKTPENLPYYEGRSMTPDQVKAYALALRAGIWEGKRDFVQALKDYKTAMVLDKEQPISLNNFAWMVATKSFATRKDYVDDALAASEHLLSLNRTPNYLDTRACAQALKGDFAAAIHTQREAVAGAPMKTGFRDRLAGFEATTPRDCTGHT